MSNGPNVYLLWAERPTRDLDLSRPIDQLAVDLPSESRVAGARLLRCHPQMAQRIIPSALSGVRTMMSALLFE